MADNTTASAKTDGTTQTASLVDKAVADGRLPAEKAETAKERAAAAIERFVNEGRPNHAPGAPANAR